MWSSIAAGLFLMVSCAHDIYQNKISLWWMILNALAALILGWYLSTGLLNMAAGALPGVMLLIAAFITGERVGKGDAGVILVLGLYLGLWPAMAILILACILLLAVGISMVALKKRRMQDYLIFAPFICVGFLLWCVVSQIGSVS